MEKLSTSIIKTDSENENYVDFETKEILLNFYDQVNQQSLKFTTVGIYDINLQFFASINVGIFSYQIILVQFRHS